MIKKSVSQTAHKIKEEALKLAELRFKVFPCRGKIPLISGGVLSASSNETLIEAWWDKFEDANIGLSTEGLIVLDLDGEKWLKSLTEDQPLHASALSRTPSGGLHYFFKRPENFAIKNSVKNLGSDVDIRTNGGYVVVPPSQNNGKSYQWILPLEEELPELAEPPLWLLKKLLVESQEKKPLAALEGEKIGEGKRNATLAGFALHCRQSGASQEEILAFLEGVNRRCAPPLETKELEAIAKSAVRYEPSQAIGAIIFGEVIQKCSGPLFEDEKAETKEEEKKHLPVEKKPDFLLPPALLSIPGFVNKVMEYNLSTAPYPNRTLAFTGALSLLSLLTGRKVKDKNGNRTNIFLVALANSGSGKEWPRKVNTDILARIGALDSLGDKLASGEGIQDRLFQCPSFLCQTDEIDGMFLSLSEKKEARYESIMNALLTLYSSANSSVPMRAKAGTENIRIIHNPHFVLYGTAVPAHYYDSLSERMLSNGLIARLLILEAEKRGEGQDNEAKDLPIDILHEAQEWLNYTEGGNLSSIFPEAREVKRSPEASKYLVEIRALIDKKYSIFDEKNDSFGTSLWARAYETICKLSLLYACSESYNRPIISIEAVVWASEFVLLLTENTFNRVIEKASSSLFEKKMKKVFVKLEEKRAIDHTELLRSSRLSARDFAEVITTLIERGSISMTMRDKKKIYSIV